LINNSGLEVETQPDEFFIAKEENEVESGVLETEQCQLSHLFQDLVDQCDFILL
jgi:hypothetical protein